MRATVTPGCAAESEPRRDTARGGWPLALWNTRRSLPEPPRTSGRFGTAAVYSRSRGPPIRPSRRPRRERARAGPARAVRAARRGLVPGRLRGSHEGPGGRLGRDRGRRARPAPRADGQRQDARRLPLGPRPARPDAGAAAHGRRGRLGPDPVHQPAQGPDLRRRAQPAGAPGRHRPGREAAGDAGPAGLHRVADRRHPVRGAPGAGQEAAGDPHHDAGVALPPPDLGRPGDAARRGARDRGRGPRHRRDQARRPPRALPRAPRAPARPGRAAPPADRPVGDAASARDDRALPGRGRDRTARSRSWTPGRGSGWTSRSWCPSRT